MIPYPARRWVCFLASMGRFCVNTVASGLVGTGLVGTCLVGTGVGGAVGAIAATAAEVRDSGSVTGVQRDASAQDGAGLRVDASRNPGCLSADPFAREELAKDIEFLAGDAMQGRSPGSPGDIRARAFIADRFRCVGLSTGSADNFNQPFTTSDGKRTGNVVGYVPGTDLAAEIIVVGAHHDHLGVKDGRVFNGANDNATGVAALLAVAQAVVRREPPPRRTIAFVAFGFEEHQGRCEGSEFYVKHSPDALPIGNVVYMVNSDMLGTYPVGGLTAFGALPGTPARSILLDLLPAYASLDVRLGRTPQRNDSDFQAFCDRGIPYIYLETWDPQCHHKSCDEAARIDYPSLSIIARLLGDVVDKLGDTNSKLAGVVHKGCER